MDLNGLCCSESSTIKCVFVRVSQRLFQSQINLKAPLPDHRVEEWMVTGETKKESCDSSPQRHKKRRGLVIDCKKKNKGWKTNKDIHIKNQMWKERRTRTEGWGQLREVSHILMSLSLTLTHCPSASHHSYQIHHPGHTSSSAQPACSCFHMQYLSLEPYATDLTLPKAFSCATGFSSLNIKPSC